MKKLLSVLTVAVISASSIGSMTAFTTNTKQNIKSNKYFKQEFTQTESVKLLSKSYAWSGKLFCNESTFSVKLQISLTKWNINWSAQKGWSHFFARMYSHIRIYHPELGQEAGKQTIKWKNILGKDEYITGYIFDKNTLDQGDSVILFLHQIIDIIALQEQILWQISIKIVIMKLVVVFMDIILVN